MAVKTWNFLLRLPFDFKHHLKLMATDQDRTINSLILTILKKEIIKFRKEKGEVQPDLFNTEHDSDKPAR